MINIIFAEPTGFINKEYANADEAISVLQNLEEKDIFIDHQLVSADVLLPQMFSDSPHIIIHDKLIGA